MQILRDNPILVLFLVAAIGQILGRLQIAGFGLGVAAVLFVGLGFGAMDPALKLPDFVYIFGLTLFVYTMGISSGPGFFASFRQKALRDNLMVLGILLLAAGLTVALCKALDLNGPYAAGLFSGALTNTPALAAVLDSLKASGVGEASLASPVVSYSIAYPGGVIGMLLAVYVAFRWLGHSNKKTSAQSQSEAQEKILESWVVRVTQAQAMKRNIYQLRQHGKLLVSFARLQRQNTVMIATDHSELEFGDLISIVGHRSDLERATKFLGEKTEEHLDWDRRFIDFRRIFVSKKSVTEVPIDSLGLGLRFGAVITRIRRGDVEIVPEYNSVLEPGDRVRVVAPRDRMDEISKFLGDSYKALSEIDVVTFSLGMALGLLLGRIPIPLPQGGTFELGFAGGPLIVGLILGRLGRTGPFVWTLPFSANLTLRQLGMVLFLAGVGTRSGYAFASTIKQGGGVWALLLAGALITFVVATLLIVIGGKVFKLPAQQLAGIIAGTQTQPAVLGYALEQAGDEQANMAYATVYPMAMIAKIIFAQLILVFW